MKGKLGTIYTNLAIQPAATVEEEASNFAKFLLSAQPFRFRFLSKQVIKALFCKRNPELLFALQNELQAISQRAIHDEPLLAQMLIHRILALYPYLEPATALRVPIYGQGKWRVISYDVERIELMTQRFGSPLTAFGLTAPGAAPLLLFMGTPLPTMSGHFLALWTDFVPGCAVGELAFQLFAKRRIQQWIEAQGQPVVLYGQSLGASLALHTVCTFHEKIKEVHAFCPAALCKRTYSRFRGEAKVVLYLHKNDIVPLVGRGFHHAWQSLFIESEPPQSPFLAHIRVVPALSLCSITAKRPSRSWWPFFTAAHFLLSIPIFCITTTVLFFKALKFMMQRLLMQPKTPR